MGQILHGSATTTEAVRRAIQHSQESLRMLAERYGINQKTVAKWKKRTSVADLPTGPRQARSTVLSVEEEAVIVAFRRYTLLPLDDCLYALQPTIPHLTRSSLHRCLQRHGIGRLPDVEGDKPFNGCTAPVLPPSPNAPGPFIEFRSELCAALIRLVSRAGNRQSAATRSDRDSAGRQDRSGS
jgi:transposase